MPDWLGGDFVRSYSSRLTRLGVTLGALLLLAHGHAPPRAEAFSAAFSRWSASTAIGVSTSVEDPSTGYRLSVTVKSIRDVPPAAYLSRQPNGIWIALDVSVTNVGSQDFDLSPADFQLLSSDAFVYRPVDQPDLVQQPLAPTTLPRGQTAQGAVLFIIPAGKPLQSALFQAAGTAQFVVAPLAP